MERESQKNPVVISLVVIALIAIIAGAVYATTQGDESSNVTNENGSGVSSEQTSEPTTAPDTTETTDVASVYNDGEYTSTGNYSTPGGDESVTVTATLADGKIESISATGSSDGGTSKQYQSQFLANYKELVVGKSVEEVELSRVSGSSLTSGGFNDAMAQIRDDARV